MGSRRTESSPMAPHLGGQPILPRSASSRGLRSGCASCNGGCRGDVDEAGPSTTCRALLQGALDRRLSRATARPCAGKRRPSRRDRVAQGRAARRFKRISGGRSPRRATGATARPPRSSLPHVAGPGVLASAPPPRAPCACAPQLRARARMRAGRRTAPPARSGGRHFARDHVPAVKRSSRKRPVRPSSERAFVPPERTSLECRASRPTRARSSVEDLRIFACRVSGSSRFVENTERLAASKSRSALRRVRERAFSCRTSRSEARADRRAVELP